MAKPKDDITTGEQIERVLDIIEDAGLFDFFFEPEKNILTEAETKTLNTMIEGQKTIKDYKPSLDELAVWNKIIEDSKAKEYTFKKTLMLKENRELTKELYKTLLPEAEYKLSTAISEIARRLPQIKSHCFYQLRLT
jgi:hypothetical protein